MTTFDGSVPIHNHGYIKLLDVMGSDQDIVDAARISYDRQGDSKDRALIRYLLRHKHTSPFEMAEMKFELRMPIFVARQWVRHRTASMNEVSARYTELPDDMFVPERVSVQSTDNKQGRGKFIDSEEILGSIEMANTKAYEWYEQLLSEGVSRELARGVLPLNIYTKFVWKMDLHNLMHFLNLRLDPHAQQEIRDYATVIEKMVEEHFPLAYEAFVDYVRDAYTLSRMEVVMVRRIIKDFRNLFVPPVDYKLTEIMESYGLGKRERTEFEEKFYG